MQATEIIVVDNASTDESVGIVEGRHPDVTLIKSQINLGLGVNLGLKEAADRFEFVGILNADTRADRTWLASTLETLRSDERIAA